MSHKSSSLLWDLSDKVVREVPHERVFMTAWSLLLGAIWVWSYVSWTAFDDEGRTKAASAGIAHQERQQVIPHWESDAGPLLSENDSSRHP